MVSLTETFGFFVGLVQKSVFMVDSENVGKCDIWERNRTVVYLPREKSRKRGFESSLVIKGQQPPTL
jgi:hypothetical protein